MSSQDVIIRLRMQGSKVFVAEASGASKAVRGIGDAAEQSERRSSKAFSAMAGAVKTGAFALGAVGAAAAAMGVKYDMGMEQSRVAFTQFLGSGKRADAMIKDLQKLNRATPFEFPELADTTKRLLAMGFSAEDAKTQTASLADAVAGIGGGGAELSRASLAIGQISSKGRLMAEDLMQLTELGIVGQQDLAKQLGMTGDEFTKAMSKGKISSEDALVAIQQVTKSNFGGAAAKQSKTFAGQLSNLKDSASMLLGEAMLPLFAFLRDEAMPALGQAMPTIKSLAMLFGQVLVGAIKGVVAAGAFLVDHWGTIKTVAMVLAPILLGIVTYMGLMTAVAIAQAAPMAILTAAWTAFNAVMALNPAVLIIAALVAVGVGLVLLYKRCEWFRNAVDAVWASIRAGWTWIKGHWPLLVSILAGPFGLAVALIVKHWAKVKSTVQGLPNTIRALGSRVLGAARDLGSKLLHGVVDGIKSAPGMILDALKSLLPGGAVGSKLADVLGVGSHAMGGMVRTPFQVVGERGPELAALPMGTRISPRIPPGVGLGSARGPITVHVQVDRRTIATAVAQDTADQQARR
jgi:tape measure domain-containing protein